MNAYHWSQIMRIRELRDGPISIICTDSGFSLCTLDGRTHTISYVDAFDTDQPYSLFRSAVKMVMALKPPPEKKSPKLDVVA